MKKQLVTLFLFCVMFSFGQENKNTIGFIENKGQIIDQNNKENKSVLYLLNTNGLNVQLRKNGFSYDVYEAEKVPIKINDINDKMFYDLESKKKKEKTNFSAKLKFHRIDIDFLNSNKNTQLLVEDKSTDYDNYYNVIHAPEGITKVFKYQKVTYKNIYNNIDVVFFIPKDSTKVVEYNFIVKPGGRVSDIQLEFKGGKTELVENKIQMNLRFGKMEETLPLSWIENGDEKQEISINFKKIKKGIFGFEGDLNNSNKIIVIDPVPVRLWGTYYGDQSNSHFTLTNSIIDTDTEGNVYLAGSTYASNNSYASIGAHQSSIPQGFSDDFNGIIAKFNGMGERVWGTYYGGTGNNFIYGIKVDNQNNIVICGVTNSSINISTNGTHQENFNDYTDSFVAKFNSNGVRLWGTYFGGEEREFCSNVAIDESNNIYIVGETWSFNNISYNSNFQVNMYQGPQYNVDAYIAKFNPNGGMVWATYAGGEKQDRFNAIKVKGNYIIVGGYTLSSQNISTPNVFQETKDNNNFHDGMLYKFTTDGFRVWSSYFGGENFDAIYTVEVDNEDNIYLGGQTLSFNNITTIGSFEYSNSQFNKGFFAKFNGQGNRIWGSYISDFSVNSIKFKNNSIYLSSRGTVSNFENTNYTNSCAYRQYGFDEGYIGKFSKSCEYNWGTLIGKITGGLTFAFHNNIIFISGRTNSNNTGIADQNSYQSEILGSIGSENYFLMKFEENNLCTSNFDPQSNSPVCLNNNITFQNIPNGYNYHWNGPNGFESYLQYPVINNANTLNSGIYNLTISDNSNCCIKTFDLNVIVGNNTPPIPNLANLPTISGDCNTIISTIPTATDNCAGLINAATSDPLTYSIPGNYTITWNYNDGNGNSSSQNQTVIINQVPLPTTSSPQNFCIQQNATIANINITGQNIKWYDAAVGGNLILNTTNLSNGTTYFASQTIGGCESNRVPVLVNIQNTQAPTANANQSFCSTANATVNDILTNGINVLWYPNATSVTPLPSNTLLIDGATYYATQTINYCESVTRTAVTISLINTLNASDFEDSFCDDLNDGKEIINLSNYNANLISTSGNIFEYYNSLTAANNQIASGLISNFINFNLNVGTTVVYVRILSPNTCSQVVKLTLKLFSKPIIPINPIVALCEGKSVKLDAGAGFDSYLWSTGATSQFLTVAQIGNYSVTVTKNNGSINCSATSSFNVILSNKATIKEVITADWTDSNNVITVNTEGNGDYEYSINGVDFQDNNNFYNLETGLYTVYVRDKNGCGIANKNVYLLMYPKFFTPNGDGFNDYWKIKFSATEPNLIVNIFDKYGKLIHQLDSTSSWDGTYNGNPLPTTDYWFVVTRENGKTYKGHFSLKR